MDTAKQVTILLDDFSRFSLCDAAVWHFTHLFSPISVPTPLSTGATSIVPTAMSVLEMTISPSSTKHHQAEEEAGVGTVPLTSKLMKSTPRNHHRALLVPETQLAFVYQSYNIVVAIDISSSVLNTALVRESSGHCNRSTILHGVLLDEVRDALQQLIVPVSLRSSTPLSTTTTTTTTTTTPCTTASRYQPEILVTIATVGSSPDDMLRPILKSFKLKVNRLDDMMDEMIQRMVALIQHDTTKRKSSNRKRDRDEIVSGSGVDVAQVLESCMLIHDTMPTRGCPAILYLTDGVGMLPSAGSYDNIIVRLTRRGITCHTVRIRGADLGNTAWGCVSDPDTMAYLAHATGGGFFDLATEKDSLAIFRGAHREEKEEKEEKK